MTTEVNTVAFTQLHKDGTPFDDMRRGKYVHIKTASNPRVSTGDVWNYSYRTWGYCAFYQEPGQEPAVNIRIEDHMDEVPPYSLVEIDGRKTRLQGGVYDRRQVEEKYGKKAGRQVSQINVHS